MNAPTEILVLEYSTFCNTLPSIQGRLGTDFSRLVIRDASRPLSSPSFSLNANGRDAYESVTLVSHVRHIIGMTDLLDTSGKLVMASNLASLFVVLVRNSNRFPL